MGTVTIFEHTTKKPITMIGEMAGVCWHGDTSDPEKNYKRGLSCLESNHGRAYEFPDIYMKIEGYYAKCLREYYTHIGGMPTRLQESTRYVDTSDFDYVTPNTVSQADANHIWNNFMDNTKYTMEILQNGYNIPREDVSIILPLTYKSMMVDKRNLRNLIEMSHQRLCKRAYWEYRQLMKDILDALAEYSNEWKFVVNNYCMPKCDYLGYCPEMKGCGRKINKDAALDILEANNGRRQT